MTSPISNVRSIHAVETFHRATGWQVHKTDAEFEERLAATMAALERWDAAERALAEAGIEMAQDVRAIISEVL